MTPTFDIHAAYARWKQGGVTKLQLAQHYGMTYGELAGKFWRYGKHQHNELPETFPMYFTRMPEPWRFEWEDFMTFADVQLPHVSETWLDRACLIAEKYLPYPRRLIIAGDLVNLDMFSQYDSESDNVPDFEEELSAAWAFFDQILETFHEVYWYFGNHELRATKATKGVMKPLMTARFVLGDFHKRVKVSPLGYCYVKSGGNDWLIAHGKNYSQLQTSMAERLSWKYGMNVVSFHEHHLAMGYDRYKNHMIINGGGLFQADQLVYANIHASTSAGMKNGFVMFRHGVPHLFGPDGFTDWRMWIDDKPVPTVGAQVRKPQAVAAGPAK